MFLINTNFRQMLFNAGNIPDGKIGMMNIVRGGPRGPGPPLDYNIYPMICDLWKIFIFDFSHLGNCPEKTWWKYFYTLYVKMYKFIMTE